MAISWGPIASAGGSKEFRIGIDLYTEGTWSDTQRWRADVWLWTKVNVTESQGILATSGSFGDVSLTGQNYSTSSGTAWSAANQKKIWSNNVDFARPYGSGTSIYCSASVSGITYVGRSLTAGHTAYATVDPRPYLPPGGPGTPSVTRVSDTSHTVTWAQAASTAAAPIQRTLVERTTGTGGWIQVANIEGAGTTFYDTSTVANERYEWRVRNYNSSGYSAYSPLSGPRFTTPATPTGVAATKSGTDIGVSWASVAPWATSYEVQDAPAGGAWSTVGSSTASPWTHMSPSATVSHAYRVRAVAPGGVASSWSAPSGTVQLLTAPAAPTNLSGGAVDPAEPWTVTWQHNPLDTTAQTQYCLRWRAQGATAWVTDAVRTSSASSHVFAAGAMPGSTPLEWQVQTRGQAAGWSPWSASQIVVRTARPVMGITSPTATIQSSTVAAAWTYYDAEGTVQSGWRARLYVGGVLVESRSGADAATSTVFASRVPDGASVRVAGEVADSAGMWSTTSTSPTVAVVYALPPTPVLGVTYDEASGAASVTIANPPGNPAVVLNRLLAEDGAGGWRLLGEGLPLDASVTDLTPVLGVSTRYRVEAVSGLPSTSVTEATVTHAPGGDRFWLTTPTGVGMALVGNPQQGVTTSRDRETVGYVGREWPVEHVGTLRAQSIRFSAVLAPDLPGSVAELEALAQGATPVCWRSPDGRRSWVSLREVSVDATRAGLASVSLSLTRIGSLDKGV